MSHHEQIVLLANELTPDDLRTVYTALFIEAGGDQWLFKLKKLRTVKVIAPELAKICVDIANMITDLDIEGSMPPAVADGNGRKA